MYYGASDALVPSTQMIRDWEPRFYIFLIPLLLLLLPLFRRRRTANVTMPAKGVAAVALVTLFLGPKVAQAHDVAAPAGKPATGMLQLFKNQDTLGKESFDAQDYAAAVRHFKDPYRQGVAEYRAGQFDKAEESFRSSHRPSVATDSAYDLGNALAQQGKYEAAVNAYEGVLKEHPKHQQAATNLKIVQDLLKKQKDQKTAQDQKSGKDQNAGGQKNGKDQKTAQGQQGGKDEQKTAQGQQGGKDEQKTAQGQQGGKDEQKTAQGQQGGKDEQKTAQDQKGGTEQRQANVQAQQNGQKQKADPAPQDGQEQKDGQGNMTEQTAASHGADHYDPRGQIAQMVARKSQADVDADLWLSRITSDPHELLKNQFAIESQRRKAQGGERSW